ncbi:MAG: hypothetical protein M3Z32_11050 [Acidobacteriota bacterium]|nr:hypothetical protein [Acidobacteriota bacterium]
MSIKWLAFAFASCAFAETFPQTEIKVLGSIDYGQTSAPVRYTGSPKYRAFEFNAKPGDRLEIWVHARRGTPKAFLTNGSFQSIAGGNPHFSTVIPRESQPATYYVVFYGSNFKRGDFTIELQRPSTGR